MDAKIIDMHVHSNASDGTFSPDALMEEAKRAGLSAMALTDHDTMDGTMLAAETAKKLDIEFIPGVELSTDYNGHEIHVLGYYVSKDHPELKSMMEQFRDFRHSRNERMIESLQEKGFSITMEDLKKRSPDSVISRAHVAKYLVETGQAPDISYLFANYIGEGCCCYIDRPKISPTEAVRLIRGAGGLCVLAHPVMYQLTDDELNQMIQEMKSEGMCGIEAIYSENTPEDEAHFRELTADFGLLVSGGSDFHGANKPHIKLGVGKGGLRIPYSILQAFKELHDKQL